MTCVNGGIDVMTFNYNGDGICLNSKIETVARIAKDSVFSKATLVINAGAPSHYTQDPHLRSTLAAPTASNTSAKSGRLLWSSKGM
jgi:hypothetical protein